MENTTPLRREFGRWLSFGVYSVSAWRHVNKQDIEVEIEHLFFITPESIHKWYSKLPQNPDPKLVEKLLRYCAKEGYMPSKWSRRMLELSKKLGLVFSMGWDELFNVMTGQVGVQLYPIPSPQKIVSSVSDTSRDFYIERDEDRIVIQKLTESSRSPDIPGLTITIKGSRQMGKSTLIMRLAEFIPQLGKQIVLLDFQYLRQTLKDMDSFYREFCRWIADELEIPDPTENIWANPSVYPRRCIRFMEKYVLPTLKSPLVIVIDNADILAEADFRDDFFSMLRGWHNSRAQPNSAWKNLELILAISTEPFYLVQNFKQSPFNVGEILSLKDFTYEQVTELNRRYDAPISNENLERLFALLNGHPYLTGCAISMVANRETTIETLLAKATEEDGPFGDHLRYLKSILLSEGYLGDLEQALKTRKCEEKTFIRLRGAGLIRGLAANVLPRCPLYAEYFLRRS
ncbi:MAG: AAA-like domain-containing protein [Anaerolineales bacterium]|nr:AAA-like domain-containing protein [Anaerolineales bacterium]